MKSLKFQSYLVLGSPEKRREKTKEILKETGINLDKVSPDIFLIAPEKTTITIDQVRDLKNHIFQKPVSLPYKVVILQEAEKLPPIVQNALLKILEEPPASAVIILEAKDKTRILPTILSRVVTITTQEKREEGTTSPLAGGKDTLELLEEVASVENPQVWLDEQMLALYSLLQKNAKSPLRLAPQSEGRGAHGTVYSGDERSEDSRISQIQTALEQCARAREMLEANVNPRHVLANLVLSINL